MKKKTSKKIKLKLPKNKRFHRFFLRRLLICLCVGVLGGTGALYYCYRKEVDSYRDDCQESWQNQINENTIIQKYYKKNILY